MTAPAGWYPDAQGAQRWWDGYRWADAMQPAAGPVRVAPGTTTVWVWLVVLAQAAMYAFALVAVTQVAPQMQDFLSAFRSDSGEGVAIVAQREAALFANPWYTANLVVPFVACGTAVLFAALDRRALQRRGIERPFHWAWSIIGLMMLYSTSVIYTIGRAVVVRRRGSHGWAPMVVSIVIQALGLIGAFASMVLVMAKVVGTG